MKYAVVNDDDFVLSFNLGSKRMPGQKQYQATGPYRVKTYTERLQEMKPKEKYSTPVAPRSHLGSTSKAPTPELQIDV